MSRTVLVAGAGPAGLMLAGELALAGVDTVVVERRAEPDTRSRGMAVHGRTLEAFAQRGLADGVRENGFVWPRTPFALMWLDLDTVDDRDHTIAYPQWRTEQLLEQRAIELGVDIRRGHEIVACHQDETSVTVDVRGPDGDYQLTGAYLVGCDGAESIVRESAGISFEAAGIPHYGMFADIPPAEGLHDSFTAGLHPTGMAAAMPIEAGTLRLMAIELDVEPPDDGPATADELRAMVTRITGSCPDLSEARWVQRFGGYTRLADRYREGRIFVAGDAAHVLFISGTQGLNAGIQDVLNLGWKLAADINGWAPPGLLDTYHAERHPVGQRICTHARAVLALLHESAGRMGPMRTLFSDFLRFEDVNRHLLQLPTAADYPSEHPNPLVGKRVGPVPDVHSALRNGRGVLVDLDGTASVAGWTDRVDVLRCPPQEGLAEGLMLVRPDGYVAHADESGSDPDALRLALTTWFGEPAGVS